jgi:hypothetical protein
VGPLSPATHSRSVPLTRVTAVSRTRGSRRTQEVTGGHEEDPARAQEVADTTGHERTRHHAGSGPCVGRCHDSQADAMKERASAPMVNGRD